MIRIARENNWYRPYYYGKYKIKEIIFYDENGIIISNGNGWLENEHKDLDYIALDLDIIPLKRKEDFSIKNAFIISNGKEDFSNDLSANLYINVNLFNVEFLEFRKEFDSIRKYYIGADNDNQEFELSINVKWLKEDWYKYQALVQENAKKLENIYTDTTIDEFAECIKNIKKYGEKMFKARRDFENYSVEDYLKEKLNEKIGK